MGEGVLDLGGKSAIVTGGAAGIGLAVVRRLAEAGASVMLADRDAKGAASEADELRSQGFNVSHVAGDVSVTQDVDSIVAAALDAFGSIDVLVNSAGVFPSMPIVDMEPEDFDRVISVNLRGVYLTTRAVAARMIERGKGGRIINVTSVDAVHPSGPGLAHYDASKHGAWGFTKSAALEFARYGIWINAVAPGPIFTPGVEESIGHGDERRIDKMREVFASQIPMGRMGEADDVAKVVLFLASDMASFVTGAQIVVDGGLLLT